MKKKILIINPNQYGYSAGYFYYVKYLKQYFEIDYICYDKGLSKVDSQGIRVIYKDFNKRSRVFRLLDFIYSSIKLSLSNNYQSIFTVNFKFVFLIGLFSKSEKNILDIRTGSLSDNYIFRFMMNKIILFNSLFFDKVTILSDSLKKKIGLNSSKTVVLPLGSDIIDESDKKFDKINLIYVGTFYKRNIEETIFGLADFYRDYNDKIQIKYDIIGFGSLLEENKIKKTINDLNMGEIIFFHGRKKHSELKGFFRQSNIGVAFVPCTDYYQVQPCTKIFEYSLSGLFTIATNTMENEKVINDSNGYIIKDNSESFYNALVKFYNNQNNINSTVIKKSLIDYQWADIVKKTLIPLIK